jgi:hypothetical protein
MLLCIKDYHLFEEFTMKSILTIASIVVVLCCTVSPQQTVAQSARNTFYAEGYGNGYNFFTINYDRLVSSNVALRIGLNPISVAIPLTASYLIGLGGASNIELGLGLTAFLQSREGITGTGVVGTGILGYRYQEPNGGLFFKAAYTPFLNGGLISWGGIGLGFTF